MFNIFKKIKQLEMKKEELEIENGKMTEAINRLNAANKEQSELISNIKVELNNAMTKVRELSEQLNMLNARQKANERFNDNDRNY
jgi:lipopolysaccharide biosynthesis regulator YciM